MAEKIRLRLAENQGTITQPESNIIILCHKGSATNLTYNIKRIKRINELLYSVPPQW